MSSGRIADCLKRTIALVRSCRTGYNQHPRAFRDFGIATRLGIAFTAVAVLAIAANLVVEHGTKVIRISGIFNAGSILRTPRPTLEFNRAVASQSTSASPSTLPTFGESAHLSDTLAQFERAVTLRAQSRTPENIALLATAAQNLAEARSQLPLSSTSATQSSLQSFAKQLLALQDDGAVFVTASDSRRASFDSYWSNFDVIDRLTKTALDQHWTIFGRVIARQSLISLSRELDDIRRQGAQLTVAGGYDGRTLQLLGDTETAFANTLQKNAAGLTRSQGGQWFEEMSRTLSAVTAARTELTNGDRRATVAFVAFEQRLRTVRGLARTALELPRSSAALGTSLARRPPADSPGVSVAIAVPEQTPMAAFTPQYTERTTEGRPRIAATLIAVISALVMGLLLVISISTVRSIVLPIRQFMQASARLAGGDATARFKRGGMPEIDSLAASLNQMASDLEASQALSREYQGALEVRIDERTRRLQFLSEHDLLTGLPNRRLLVHHLDESLRQAAATHTNVAVFFLDLDNFKNINDSLGHTFGDRVLQAAAHRVRLTAGPHGFAARLGGDEFAVVHSHNETLESVLERGKQIAAAFLIPLQVEGRELLVSVSVGAGVYPTHATHTEVLLSAADGALFHAKGQGRNRFCMFTPELLETATEKFNTEQALRRALDRGEFELVFQPEVSVSFGGIKLMEALLRWRLPDGRCITPMRFLPTAEEAGLMNEIGDWVLRSAIESAARWHRGSWREVRIAINVSASQLISKGFTKRVEYLLMQHKLPARCIELELTETVLQTHPTTIETLRELRALNIAVALDDFGTGFSSLSSLQHLPLTRVKIDQSLIAAIDRDDRALAIAGAIIDLCGKLSLDVTAEGIERPQQLHRLFEYPDVCLQGYLLSFPVEAEQVVAAVENMPSHLQSLLLTTPATPALQRLPIALPADDHTQLARKVESQA